MQNIWGYIEIELEKIKETAIKNSNRIQNEECICFKDKTQASITEEEKENNLKHGRECKIFDGYSKRNNLWVIGILEGEATDRRGKESLLEEMVAEYFSNHWESSCA